MFRGVWFFWIRIDEMDDKKGKKLDEVKLLKEERV